MAADRAGHRGGRPGGWRGGGRLIYVGAGTSGPHRRARRVGVPADVRHAARAGRRRIIAGGPDADRRRRRRAPRTTSTPATPRSTTAGVDRPTSVVGIASSGRTPYVVAAAARGARASVRVHRRRCRATWTSQLSAVCDARRSRCPVGPEVLAGSTRLKAGTAQKLVLNMLSTIAMVRLGKTYGNLMVDLRADQRRSCGRGPSGIVGDVAGVGRDEAVEALRRPRTATSSRRCSSLGAGSTRGGVTAGSTEPADASEAPLDATALEES